MPNGETVITTASLFIKATILAARWAGAARKRALSSIASMSVDEKCKEIFFLHDRVEQLEMQVNILQKHANKRARSPRYTISERLHVIWFVEYFQIPRRKVTDYCGIARSTLYRWLHRIDDACRAPLAPHNRTPGDVVALVWEVARANVEWGRVRIANQLALLGVFLAASTVRNILNRPKPRVTPGHSSHVAGEHQDQETGRSICAFYPNHVWSIDRTQVSLWGLWPTYVLIAIDHFSRKVVCVCPLEGPNGGWVCGALEGAFIAFGPPRHLISDHEGVFISAALSELLEHWHVKPRLGAVGKHGSIAVTERVIWTLKYEWLHRVALIRGFDHLASLCSDFTEWHNAWRPHMHLAGARPNDVYGRDLPERVPRDAKTAPQQIERRRFAETRVTGFRLPKAA